MKFSVKIADVTAEIIHGHEYIKELCRDYICSEEAEFSVCADENEVRELYKKGQGRATLGVCEATSIHRNLTNELAKKGVLLIHSAAIERKGKAYIFLAKSGVGKSTHIRLWQKCFPDTRVINGDKPYYRFENGKLRVYGSPWRGKEMLGENCTAVVEGICFLSRGEQNICREISKSEAVMRIFHQVLIPSDSQTQEIFMSKLDEIMSNVPMYSLYCNMDDGAAITAYGEMSKEDGK